WYHFLTCDAVPFFFLSQIALASFYEDGGDEDIMTLPQPTSSSVTRGTAASDHRVTSFRDLVHAQEEEEEEEEGQRFYAGGSERSGQQIVGPPRKKSSNELVEDLFRGAKEHGAVAVDRTAKSPGEGSRPKPFAGGGYRLGAAPEEESAYVAGELKQNAAQDVSSSGLDLKSELRGSQTYCRESRSKNSRVPKLRSCWQAVEFLNSP
ncbi:NSFL1 cofactor p47-like, partial [Pseudonaja textilis]|uniref:NSFL1 cofactor p47-like n=1 Tax=Pseudonaja textilis TaxID=8673 RepID=UPI000EAAA8CC